ncbi:hypothetical protein BH09BAC1_BH09BAC1_15610 [soil metagenome]
MKNYPQKPNDELQPILQSLKGMHRAQAPDGLFERVMEQMNRPVVKMVPISRISLVAASLVALIGLNIAIIAIKQNQSNGSGLPLMEYYGTSSEYGYSY